MRIVVTGGAGFIGGAVADQLLKTGHEVLVIDNLATGHESRVPTKAKFERLGAEDPRVEPVLKSFRPEAVAHVGGQSSGEIGEKRPLDDINWNVVSTLNLLRVAHALGTKRFVFASSMGVYGLAASPLREEQAGNPISVYGVGKVAAEGYLRAYAGRGMTCVALRMFNVYGPGQNMENQLQGMVSIFLDQLLKTGKVVVRGSLERVRDFIFIDDVVSAWDAALTRTAIPSGFSAANVATGVGTPVKELLKSMQDVGGAFPVECSDGTPADQVATVADIARAKSLLGWQPKVSLSDGVARFHAWAAPKYRDKNRD